MVRLSSVSDEAEKENEKLQGRRLFKQRYYHHYYGLRRVG